MISIEKLKPTAATAIIITLSVFFSITLSFFLLNRPLFLSLDLVRLTAVCIGLSLAVIILNFFIVWFLLVVTEEPAEPDDPEKKKLNFGFGQDCYLMEL